VDVRSDGGEWPKRAEYQRWRDEYRFADEETRRAAKPFDIARAELELGLMDRFGYPSLKAMRKESAEILQLLAVEAFGWPADQKEEQERLKMEAESQRGNSYE
jgi:hypothetical protein